MSENSPKFISKIKNLNREEKRRAAIALAILLFIPLVLVIAFNVRKNSEEAVKAATSTSRSPMALGISLPYGRASKDVNVDAAIAEIEAFAAPVDEGGVGRYPASYSIWMDFSESNWEYGSRGSFPNEKLLNYLDSKNITPVIFLAPVGRGISKGENKPDEAIKYSNNSIANGSFDTFFDNFAASASAYGKPVVVRYAWEMNGTWFPWSPYSLNGNGKTYYDMGNTPENYVSAWRHVYSKIKSKAPNVLFYWCFNEVKGVNDYLARFYPGNNYVDFVGFDSYNTYPLGGNNLTLSEEYKGSIEATRQIVSGSTTKLSTKPIVVGETGLVVNNADRANKLNYNTIYNNYADLASIIYFDLDVDHLFGIAAEPGRNWRLSGYSTNPNIAGAQGPDLRPKYASFLVDPKFQGALVKAAPTPTQTSTPTPSPTNTPTPSPTPTSVTINITPKADAYVTSTSPKTNFGTATVLRAKASDPVSSTYLKFTLPNLSGKTILSASLRLTVANSDDAAVGSANKIDIKNTSNNWTQETLTYSNKPAGGSVVGTKFGAIARNTTFEINVLPGVQGKSGDVSFVLESAASNANNLILYSSNVSNNKPALVITYR